MSSNSEVLSQEISTYLDFSDCGLFDKNIINMVDIINQNDFFKELNLYRNNLTDRIMTKLAALKHIEEINLCHNNITDTGIKNFINELSKHNNKTKLRSLNFSRNSVTIESIDKLRKILPECRITF